jgi:hypothetical protein
MATMERPKPRPVVMAERRAAHAASAAARDREDIARLTRDLAEMRDDRDRWRKMAEKLGSALDRLKGVASPLEATTPVEVPGAADVLYGVKAIAAFFGTPVKATRHRVEADEIPTFKMGRIVCARRSALSVWLAERQANTQAAAGAR